MPGSESVAYIQMSFIAMLLQHCHRASDSLKAHAEYSPTGQRLNNWNTCNHIQIEFASSDLKKIVLKASVKTGPCRMAGKSAFIFLWCYFIMPLLSLVGIVNWEKKGDVSRSKVLAINDVLRAKLHTK